MCSGLSYGFTMCFKRFGVLFFSVRLRFLPLFGMCVCHVFIKLGYLLTYLLSYLLTYNVSRVPASNLTQAKMNMSFFRRSRIAVESNAYRNFDHFRRSRMRRGISRIIVESQL